jgi:lipoic acid synthetase
VAAAVSELEIEHAVITSVTRDDLPDRGARQFQLTMKAVKRIDAAGLARGSRRTLEVLVPELTEDGVDGVMACRPDVFGHNVETVPRLYPEVRTGANYKRALAILNRANTPQGGGEKRPRVKSGLMVGMGETFDEVVGALKDLGTAGVDMVTIGQYLRPSRGAMKVARFVPPDEFEAMASAARRLGFQSVAAGPFVRSSYL